MVKKFTDYSAFADVADDDILLGVDVSDTTQSAGGSSKKLSVGSLREAVTNDSVQKDFTNLNFRLWDYSTDSGIEEGKKFVFSTSTPVADVNGRISGYIPVEPETAYRLVGYLSTVNIYHGFYDQDQNPINAANQVSANTITTPANCYFMRLGLSASATQYGYGEDQYNKVVFLPASSSPGLEAFQHPYPYYEALEGQSEIDGYLLRSRLTKDIVKAVGKNLFNYQDVCTNLYIQGNGIPVFTANEFSTCTRFIPVEEGLPYSYSGGVSMPQGWAFYDADFAVVDSASTQFGINRVAPAGSAYVRIQLVAFNAGEDRSDNYRYLQFEQAAAPTDFEEYTEKSWDRSASAITATVLTGKKVLSLGDSITETTPSWHDYLVSNTGAASTSVKNAVGGREVGEFLDPEAGEDASDVTAKISDADYIFIMGGANHRSGPYGSIADATINKTGDLVQQLNYLIDAVETANATAPVVFVIPPTNTTDSATELAALPEAYQTVIDWCEDRGYLWIPVWHEYPRSKIFPSARHYVSNVTSTATHIKGDGTHPSQDGHRTVSEIVIDILVAAAAAGVIS